MNENINLIAPMPEGPITITKIQGYFIIFELILFCILTILSIVSIFLNYKRKSKKRIIYQIIISILTLIGAFYIVENSIMLFGLNSDLYIGLVILAMGNILTIINIVKK